MISSCTKPYERVFRGYSRGEDCCVKACPASLVLDPLAITTPCLSWKLISPLPRADFTILMPIEYPSAANASWKALTIRSRQNSFENTALPIFPIHRPTVRHARTTKFDVGLLVIGRAADQSGAAFPYDPRLVNGALENSGSCILGDSTSLSTFSDKAYLPGIKPTIGVTMVRKEKVIFRRNYFSLSIATPFKSEKLNPPSRGL